MTTAAASEPNTAMGTLRPGFLASPDMLIGLWKPLRLKMMPLVAAAPSRVAAWTGGPPVCRPRAKLAGWKPAMSRTTPVSSGTTSLNAVIAPLVST